MEEEKDKFEELVEQMLKLGWITKRQEEMIRSWWGK